MGLERYGGLRAAIAQLAAQIMYGEDVKEYFTAKRLAAKRLLGQSGAKQLRYRPRDLPSNGEIKEALLELVTSIEGESRTRRLFAMRICALEAMEPLEPFQPRLIGSVATGHVRSGSDVDLHVFAHDAEDVASHLRAIGWVFEMQRVQIMKHNKVQEFTHLRVPDVFPLELTVYAPREIGIRSRSSTNGKPIVRVRAATLRRVCEHEHPELWRRYVERGEVPSLDEIASDEDAEEGAAEPAYSLFELGAEGHDPWLEEEVEQEEVDDPDDFVEPDVEHGDDAAYEDVGVTRSVRKRRCRAGDDVS
jgi:hypothetical protein